MSLENELKTMIIKELQVPDIKPEELRDDDYLFGEEQGLSLDSLDAVELTVLLKKYYGINLRNRNEAREAFTSFKTLADYIRQHQEQA